VVADPDREENAMQSWEITRRGFAKELAVAIGLSVLRTAEATIAARHEPCRDADPEFDLAFSFAGANREYVAGTKAACDRLGLRVMYDQDMTNRWWGENFIAEQRRMYGGRALFFVPFLSTDYFRRTIPPDELATAAWTDLERGGGHILPVLIDDTRIPPHLLPRHIGYLRARDYSAEDLAQEMLHKVSRARNTRPSH
jgi:hypothetical protein